MTSTHARVLALGLALLPGCSPDPAAHEDAPPGVPLSQIEHQRAENRRLERLLTLAASNQFYLLLEPERGRLRLMYDGADLRDWAVLEAAVGRRRVLFSDRSLPGDWWESVWQDGELEPAREVDRAVIDPPDGGPLDSVAVVIPPTPEEAIPAPDHFLINYRDGRGLEIVGRDTSQAATTTREGTEVSGRRLERLRHALWPWGRLTVRLRLVLPVEEASELYRSLPEGSAFYIVVNTPR